MLCAISTDSFEAQRILAHYYVLYIIVFTTGKHQLTSSDFELLASSYEHSSVCVTRTRTIIISVQYAIAIVQHYKYMSYVMMCDV